MNNNSVFRSAMQFGAYSGLSSFVFFLLLYFTTSNPLGNKSWLGAWIPIVFIVLGTKFHRDHNNEGYINYGRAFGTGVLIALFASILNALLVYLFGTIADAVILENYKAEATAGIDQARQYLSNESVLAKLDEAVEKINTMTMKEIAASVFYNGFFGGIFVSLIVGAILKRNKPFFDDPSSQPSNPA